ncbi:helix-turn-helix domain-containing protein [Streptomyces prasinus]|uniref:helix-turn-helix domain-containing protein n=1 Tax=Streptomyces prasinus TaxID=67345 RepID=UPI002F3FB2A9
MRYPQGGGLTVERQAFRERIRMEAAEVFATGQDNATVTKELRVSVRSVQRWRRSWQEGGRQTLHSQGIGRPSQAARGPQARRPAQLHLDGCLAATGLPLTTLRRQAQ